MKWETQDRRRESRAGGSRFGPGDFALWLPVGFLLFLGIGAVMHQLPWAIPAAYSVASLLSAAAYAHDKSKAQSGEWRTPETVLHLLDLLGGWPGGLLAQRIVRHKNRKIWFQAIFWLCALLHLAFWSWVFAAVPAESGFWAFVSKVIATLGKTVDALRSASCFALPGLWASISPLPT
jgi:uncharacterized membrane protein YsdA (DUF1294 family)